ncbi:CotH kinase family protein [Bacteroidia bacterium]|nr:CotH kinase family protein [Bacteroidia bacterium]MDB9882559.1 CotH kinase family protein [Bacteroidia bacterium]
MKNRTIKITALALVTIGFFACKKVIFVPDEDGGTTTVTGIETHDNGFPANYNIVFDNSKVHRMEIVFTSQEWADMQADLADKTRGGGGPGGTFNSENPTYFGADIYCNNLVWKDVGVRYKGNSSLRARSGKLPLRFDFDKFEDINPAISDQRFYGFKELSMGSNYNDPSLIREKTADDLFRDFGVPAVRTAYYEIYIDQGDGVLNYYGVYTMCEIVFDTFLKDWFGSKSGNCYKPDGDGAKFASAGFDLDDLELKTNEDINDKSDVQEMHDFLHTATRTSDPPKWRADLESTFDVDGFLKYLAVNNTIQNWDTYGKMTHNYYLYHDPADDLIKWIAWDNNEAFQIGKMGGSLSFAMTEVGTDWPLINYIIADVEYLTKYKSYVKSFIETSFANSRMDGIYSAEESLLQASADAERNGYSYVNGQFNSAISTLKSHNSSRITAAEAYIQ